MKFLLIGGEPAGMTVEVADDNTEAIRLVMPGLIIPGAAIKAFDYILHHPPLDPPLPIGLAVLASESLTWGLLQLMVAYVKDNGKVASDIPDVERFPLVLPPSGTRH
jgi:hypothetical protein